MSESLIRSRLPVFLHQGRAIVSLPGMHEIGDTLTTILNEQHLNAVSHLKVKWHAFANHEGKPEIFESIRGVHAFLLCPLQFPNPDSAFMRAMITADALKRASVDGITYVAPYFSFARQDRKANAREPITARMIADFMGTNASIQRMITFDVHAAQIQGFFSIPVDDLHGLVLHAAYIRRRFTKKEDFRKVTIIAPDIGSVKRAEKLADLLGEVWKIVVPFAIIDKKRQKTNEAKTAAIIGRVRGRHCIFVDDMIDGGGTMRNAYTTVMDAGALSAEAAVTHLILSGNATKKFQKLGMRVIGTQTIPRSPAFREKHKKWLNFEPIEPRLAQTIHEASIVGGSVSKLFVK